MFRTGWLVAVLGACGLGCGPVQYGVQVTSRANAAMTAARNAGADRLAPYEYFQAVEYLHKAREEGSFSQYQNALYYGKKAEDAAVKATQVAQERAAKGEVPGPPADKPAPAAAGKGDKAADDKKDDKKGKAPAKPAKPDPDMPQGADENPRPPTP